MVNTGKNSAGLVLIAMLDTDHRTKSWEYKFHQSRAALEEFAHHERSWLSSIGDPRTYQSDMRETFDRYVAVFPSVPADLSKSLASAIRLALDGMHAVAQDLACAPGNDRVGNILFPFAPDYQRFFSKSHQMLLGRFSKKVQEMLCDMAPYEDGDPKLFLLYQLAAYGTGLGLEPYASVPSDSPPRIGVLQLKGKTVEVSEELSVEDNGLVIAQRGEGWNADTRTLVVAQWPRRRNVHVQAKVRAWANYGPFPSAPFLASDKPALAFTREIIARAYDAARDLSRLASHDTQQPQRSSSA